MASQAPKDFSIDLYLRQLLRTGEKSRPFYVATEKDFAGSAGINYPYRSHFYVLALLHKGDCRIKIGINEYRLTERTVSFVGPGIVRHWTKTDWTAPNHTLFFIPEFFKPPFSAQLLSGYPFFNSGAQHALQLLPDDYQKACALIEQIVAHGSNEATVQGLLFALLSFLNETYQVVTKGVSNSTKNTRLANRFVQLLTKHHREQKSVQFYADALQLSPKSLSELLRKETGVSAKEAIEDFVLLEAKSLLKQTEMSVKEIVYWLGYEDPSYFTKLFKSKVGITPLAYRSS